MAEIEVNHDAVADVLQQAQRVMRAARVAAAEVPVNKESFDTRELLDEKGEMLHTRWS